MNGQFQWADSLSSLYLCWWDFAQDSRLQVWTMEESWVVWWSLLVWMKWNTRPCCFGSRIILALVTLFLQVLQFPIHLFPLPLTGACHYRVTWKRKYMIHRCRSYSFYSTLSFHSIQVHTAQSSNTYVSLTFRASVTCFQNVCLSHRFRGWQILNSLISLLIRTCLAYQIVQWMAVVLPAEWQWSYQQCKPMVQEKKRCKTK